MPLKKCEPCGGTGTLPNGKVCYKCNGNGVYIFACESVEMSKGAASTN